MHAQSRTANCTSQIATLSCEHSTFENAHLCVHIVSLVALSLLNARLEESAGKINGLCKLDKLCVINSSCINCANRKRFTRTLALCRNAYWSRHTNEKRICKCVWWKFVQTCKSVSPRKWTNTFLIVKVTREYFLNWHFPHTFRHVYCMLYEHTHSITSAERYYFCSFC